MDTNPPGKFHLPAVVRTNHVVRTGAFAVSFAILAVHAWEQSLPPAVWGLLVVQFLVYPQLVYLRARHSRDPRNAELHNLYADALLLGAWTAALGFPVWIAYSFLVSTSLNAIVNRGGIGLIAAVVFFALGAVAWLAFGRQVHGGATSPLVTTLCFFASLVYTWAVGHVVWSSHRSLLEAKSQLGQTERQYRLIAESAGDLVGLVDRHGRWLYASPSHLELYEPAELERGADAFQRFRQEDAQRARAIVGDVVESGKLRSFSARMVDRQGRARSYHFRARSIESADAQAPRAVLIVALSAADEVETSR